ncbi:MAG: hypothetical protein H6837_05845 [Planctomycetes bacterium]|nr:hypothetical protein [Planctomycetota bacterium]
MTATQTAGDEPARVFQLDHYLIRRKVLKILGGAFHVFDRKDALVGYSQQKAFKLKEDIRVYTDDTLQEELLLVKARQIIDFAAAYDIVDSRTGAKVGAARRKGLKSILRDSWELLDVNDKVLGKLEEDSAGMALARRLLSNLIPQRFRLSAGSRPPVHFAQRFNPFIYKLEVDLPQGHGFDPRLVFALAVLICAIEGRQD